MKAQPLKLIDGVLTQVEPAEATHLKFHTPGPTGVSVLPVILRGSRDEARAWTWNGSVDRPTLKPSVKTWYGGYDQTKICHTWITDGKAQFLPDTTHEFSGQTLDLIDL